MRNLRMDPETMDRPRERDPPPRRPEPTPDCPYLETGKRALMSPDDIKFSGRAEGTPYDEKMDLFYNMDTDMDRMVTQQECADYLKK